MFTQQVSRKFLAVFGAVMLSVLPLTAFAGGSPSDEAIHREVQKTLDRCVNSVGFKVENGHVYLKGHFDTHADKTAVLRDIESINGVRGVYDYTEQIGGK